MRLEGVGFAGSMWITASHSRAWCDAIQSGWLEALAGIGLRSIVDRGLFRRSPVSSWILRVWMLIIGTGISGETVQFEAAMRELGEHGHAVFIEASPHPVLTAAIEETLADGVGGFRCRGGGSVVGSR